MNTLVTILLTGITVFCTFTLEGISGFGSTVLALPFIIMLLGLHQAVPFLSSLGWVLALYIVIRSRRDISWKEYGFIALHVALGIPVGLLLMARIPARPMTAVLVGFMLVVGVRGLLTLYRQRRSSQALPAAEMPPKNILMRAVLFAGGIIHGAFSSGGPFVVIYAARALPDKSLFRVTLSMLWLTVNSIMLIKWSVAGNVWNRELGMAIVCALPFICCGMVLGDWLHHKVNSYYFRVLVYSLLVVAGSILFFSRVI